MTPRDKALNAAREHRDKATAERRKRYGLIRDCGYRNPQWDRWGDVVKEAASEIRSRHDEVSFSADAAPLSSNFKQRTRVVPSDYIAVRAEDIVGMEAALSEARELLHKLAADRAEWIAAGMGGWPDVPEVKP